MSGFAKLTQGSFVTPVVLATVASAGLATLASNALFTDSDSFSESFTAGSVKLNANDSVSQAINLDNLAPGDVSYHGMEIVNAGSLDLRYSLAASSVDGAVTGLGAALQTGVKVIASADACNATTYGASVTTAYAKANLSALGFGSSAAGAQAGDRSLTVGAGEKLCFLFDLPSTTGNALQESSTTVTFTFSSEQTKNNA